MADNATVAVTVNAALVARVRVLEAAMRKIMVPTCQCVNCLTLREALENAPAPQPPAPEVEQEGEVLRCWDCGREMLSGEPRYMVVGASWVGRIWRCQGCVEALSLESDSAVPPHPDPLPLGDGETSAAPGE